MAEAVLTEPAEALSRRDPAAAATLLAPTRARAARLRGALDRAAAHLAAAQATQPQDELRPPRVTFLLESAHLAATTGDVGTAVRRLTDLDRQAREIGLMLAAPDLERLDDLLHRVRPGVDGSNS